MNKGLELKFLNKTRIFTLYVIIHFSARLDVRCLLNCSKLPSGGTLISECTQQKFIRTKHCCSDKNAEPAPPTFSELLGDLNTIMLNNGCLRKFENPKFRTSSK